MKPTTLNASAQKSWEKLEYLDTLDQSGAARPFAADSHQSQTHDQAKKLGVIVFIHGYPDDASLWNEQIAALQSEFRCVALNLPGYGKEKLEFGKALDFSEVVESIESTLAQLNPTLPKSFHLVTHDWGAVYGYLYASKNPDRVKSFTAVDVGAVDVGAVVGKQQNPAGYLVMPLYQLLLASSYLSGQIPVLGGRLAKLITATVFGGLNLIGGGKQLAGPSRLTPFSDTQNYPYYFFWKSILFDKSKLKYSLPKVPFFFAYGDSGMKKLMNFHSEKWLSSLRSRSDCLVHEFKGAGHWLMKDRADEFNERLRSFLLANV